MSADGQGSREPSPPQVALMADLKAALGKHPDMSAPEMLGVVAQLAGNLIALQDRRYSPEQVMDMVGKNIEIGNATAITAVAMGIIKL